MKLQTQNALVRLFQQVALTQARLRVHHMGCTKTGTKASKWFMSRSAIWRAMTFALLTEILPQGHIKYTYFWPHFSCYKTRRHFSRVKLILNNVNFSSAFSFSSFFFWSVCFGENYCFSLAVYTFMHIEKFGLLFSYTFMH